jgi:hypothetical protein
MRNEKLPTDYTDYTDRRANKFNIFSKFYTAKLEVSCQFFAPKKSVKSVGSFALGLSFFHPGLHAHAPADLAGFLCC